jgi:hypothetical protein
MRRLSSYGPIDKELHYFVPRKKIINNAFSQLTGEVPEKGGHYITVWAPRQRGKTWIMQEVARKIKQSQEYEVGILSMERAKEEENEIKILNIFIKKLNMVFHKSLPFIQQISDLPDLFTKQYFTKPVVSKYDKNRSKIKIRLVKREESQSLSLNLTLFKIQKSVRVLSY